MVDQTQDKLQIRLHVYDTDLSVRIPREDEEYYRKSAKLIHILKSLRGVRATRRFCIWHYLMWR